MNTDQLMTTRDDWYDAFFAGDAQRLAALEAAHFIVESPQGRQSKRSQIAAIHGARERGEWFPKGGERVDLQVEIVKEIESDVWKLTGTGYIRNGGKAGPVSRFEEHWRWTGNTWQVTWLRYEPTGEPERTGS